MLRKRFLLLFMVIAVGLGLLWIEDYTQQTIAENSENAALLPDYYGEGLSSRSFDDQGEFNRQFKARRSVHYPAQNLTEFNDPRLHTVDKQDGSLWQVTALRGIMHENDNKLVLHENVIITPLDPNQDNAITMQTNRLDVYNERNIAETDLAVEVTASNGSINAIGMKINFSQQKVEFQSEVNARYVP